MTSKNYGPSTNYLDPTGRNFEVTVFQAGKPVLSSELNLQQDIGGGFAQGALRRAMPSGWISDDYTVSSDMAAAFFNPNPASNVVVIPPLVAHVNGWLLDVRYTDDTIANRLVVPGPPVGAGSLRTDLVLLEVWRRLISASTGDGKSPTQRIWRNGNVKVTTDTDPYTLASDILDTNVGQETTKRVQIQYRLRVIPGVDVTAHPYVMDDPTVTAHTVPATPGAPDGFATTYLYASQSANGDAGLWVAGDGSLAAQSTLGTVDGFMYAIPLMGIVRRNQTAFDRLTNHNGGVVSPGPSDRPDGLLADVIVDRDILDLRQGVSPTGWSYSEVLQKNLGYLLDNAIRTETALSPVGGGYFGHTLFTAAEIGVLPGDHITTGDTPGAHFTGQFDHVRRFFSDRPILETVTVALSRPGGGSWAPGDTVSIQPTSLTVYPFAPFNWASRNPSTVVFSGLSNFRWVGETAGKKTASADSSIRLVQGIGTLPVSTVQIELGSIPPGITDERLFVDLAIEWPAGQGLEYTPTATFTGSVQINNPGVLPSGAALTNVNFDFPHREVQLQYQQDPRTITQMAEETSGATSFVLPERASSVISVLLGALPVTFVLGPDGRTVSLPSNTTNPTDVLTIAYIPLRPLPEGSVQVTVYYEARAPQTVREDLLGTTLTVIPRHIDGSLYTLTTGSGSPDEAYPFPYGYVQVGGVYPGSAGTFEGDFELCGSAQVSTSEFNAATGLLRIPTYVGYTPNPQEVQFTRIAGHLDNEGRTFFPFVPSGIYTPNAYAQPLSEARRHRNFLAVLGELSEDCTMGFRGQLVLMLLVREAVADKLNAVAFDPNPAVNTTVASVYRLKGNLLAKRA